MPTTTIVLLVVLVALAVAAATLIMRARRAKRREQLQERFGPEYERAVEEHGDRRAAETHLADTAYRRDSLDVRALEPAERQRYAEQWTGVQAAFVDEPAGATRDADRLVQAVMRDRGYPVDDFETRADMVAADHPDVVEHYRAAHAVGSRSEAANTEELRQAFVHYRVLFQVLLDEGREAGRHAERPDEVDLRATERTEHTRPA
jgi:hypothetical protein